MAQHTANPLPRWRGFNLLNMFTTQQDGVFQEDDLRWISDWGFDFIRIPMSYLRWTDGHWRNIRESALEEVDRVVDLGIRYGLHVNLNFHRAPGYCIASEPVEPFNLWKDAEAQEAFRFHWELFTRRYKGIDSKKLSFNLVNEPLGINKWMSREDHESVIRATTAAIRAIDPDRLIIIDGIKAGNESCPELTDLGVGQSCRAYLPMGISHYQAPWTFSWMKPQDVPPPAWPGGWNTDRRLWDRADLERHYQPWLDLAKRGVGVHCGEGGAFNRTPHDVVLAWLGDVLDILRGGDIGWALWNFRGSMGILDSQRADVTYQDWHGHALDAKLLQLLRDS